MSEEQLKAFLEKVQGDTSLQEKLKAAADADAVAAIAKEAGFSISADDFKNAQLDLSDEQLDSVAGGNCYFGGDLPKSALASDSNGQCGWCRRRW